MRRAEPPLLLQLRAERFGIRDRIRLRTHVRALAWDERERLWTATLGGGETLRARFVLSGPGGFRSPAIVAEMTLAAIRADRLYLFTNPEMRPGIAMRLDRIERDYDASLEDRRRIKER